MVLPRWLYPVSCAFFLYAILVFFQLTNIDLIWEDAQGSQDGQSDIARVEDGLKPSSEVLDRLESMGYIPWIEEEVAPANLGVVKYSKKDTYPGYLLFTTLSSNFIHIMDLEGNIIHEVPLGGICKRSIHVELFEDSFFITCKNGPLAKMAFNGSLEWLQDLKHHHDFDFTDEKIYSLTSDMRVVEGVRPFDRLTINDNYIAVLDPDGELIEEISIFEIVRDDFTEEIDFLLSFRNITKNLPINPNLIYSVDILHTNTVDVITEDIGVGKPGDLLLCLRNLNTIAILDIEKRELVWSWGFGVLDFPHQPSILPNGNILIFKCDHFNGYRLKMIIYFLHQFAHGSTLSSYQYRSIENRIYCFAPLNCNLLRIIDEGDL